MRMPFRRFSPTKSKLVLAGQSRNKPVQGGDFRWAKDNCAGLGRAVQRLNGGYVGAIRQRGVCSERWEHERGPVGSVVIQTQSVPQLVEQILEYGAAAAFELVVSVAQSRHSVLLGIFDRQGYVGHELIIPVEIIRGITGDELRLRR